MNPIQAIENRPTRLMADPWLTPLQRAALQARSNHVKSLCRKWLGRRSLHAFANWHRHYGLHEERGEWRFREWLPHATALTLFGSFCQWRLEAGIPCTRRDDGEWEARFPASALRHGDEYRMHVEWPGGAGERLPSCADFVVRDTRELSRSDVMFNAKVWKPERPYAWKHDAHAPRIGTPPLIYEAHVGMATEHFGIGSFTEFRKTVLPYIAAGGYRYVQLMAILQHAYYGSFGYHATNFFSVCDLFGTPDDFRAMVDEAHRLGLGVIIDLVHSHAAANAVEGLACLDGTDSLFFHEGGRGRHPVWNSCCFDYGNRQTCRFLLSNCRYWLEEYHVDGFRFDGVTSMLYKDHGLRAFSGYDDYFSDNVDEDAWSYLCLANALCHDPRYGGRPLTFAEDVSGMPGLASPAADGGAGFDYRLAMGVTDFWFRLTDLPDEDWPLDTLWHELNNRRADEKTLSYVECHDQSLVGGKSLIFQMAGKAMYDGMALNAENLAAERACALHKMARLATAATAGFGYLNFMGNEFGHPEWVDFPREGNGWSFQMARRQWSLAKDKSLRYTGLLAFDRAMMALVGTKGFYDRRPQLIRLDNAAKILVFERADYWFLFNFHPTTSLKDYVIPCLSGSYKLILDSDAPAFGGQGRVKAGQVFIPRAQTLSVYLPCRVCLVLKREAAEATNSRRPADNGHQKG